MYAVSTSSGGATELKVPLDIVTAQTEVPPLTRDEGGGPGAVAADRTLVLAQGSVPGSSGWSEEGEVPWEGDAKMWGDGGVALMRFSLCPGAGPAQGRRS